MHRLVDTSPHYVKFSWFFNAVDVSNRGDVGAMFSPGIASLERFACGANGQREGKDEPTEAGDFIVDDTSSDVIEEVEEELRDDSEASEEDEYEEEEEEESVVELMEQERMASGEDDVSEGRTKSRKRAASRSVSYVEIFDSSEDEEDGQHEEDTMLPAVDVTTQTKSVGDSGFDSDQENRNPIRQRVDGRPRRMSARRKIYVIPSESEDEMEEEEEVMADEVLDQGYEEDVYVDRQPDAIEAILFSRRSENGKREFHVKYVNRSYREAQWIERDHLINAGKKSLISGFERRLQEGKIDPYGDLVNGIHPTWTTIDRIFAEREVRVGDNKVKQFYVKWNGRSYAESTWETLESLATDADQQALEKYKVSKQAEKEKTAPNASGIEKAIDLTKMPNFNNGRSLRPYQVESLKWMAQNWYSSKNCILGDEMGLGKTAQSIAAMAFQKQFGGVTCPFLVIAPLTTLGHWQREIETWTDMNCLVYCGTRDDKSVILKYEVWCENEGKRTKIVKPDVVLSSFEHVMRDASFFQGIEWESMIIDEAHRMKGTKGATRTAIAGIPCQWILLLTGTPIQNNVRELYGLLNLLEPSRYDDEDDFLDRFGRDTSAMTPEQVKDLQNALKPLLLRRMKEDVETLPEKEECIIWVQLTNEQRAYYRAIFEKQIGTLMSGSKYVPALRNVAMELRKVCCHPFLCDGVEDDMKERRKQRGEVKLDDLEMLTSSCGKMQLLHKFLPKLRQEKRKVLIFSQFTIMLDVLEDYIHHMNYPVERIDGNTSSRDRQAAIDRFSQDGNDGFLFLLSTKAGGQGITLTAADTCIIYDSDWNPQNDLQVGKSIAFNDHEAGHSFNVLMLHHNVLSCRQWLDAIELGRQKTLPYTDW